MNASLRQSMASLHTWTGLLLGWLLFAIFVTGTVSYFQDEITRWMQPEIEGRSDPASAAKSAIDYLEKVAPGARSWYIALPGPRSLTTQVYWQPGADAPLQDRKETQALLDTEGHPAALRDTRGGSFLYRFHFDLYGVPVIWARYLVGIAAMAMLVAILSGVITHKKIFADFFLLRLGKGQRSWLDAHNVSAVLALPFHAMITFTGLVTLATLYMPFGIAANYAQPANFFETVNGTSAPTERSGKAMALPPIDTLMERASQHWGRARPRGRAFPRKASWSGYTPGASQTSRYAGSISGSALPAPQWWERALSCGPSSAGSGSQIRPARTSDFVSSNASTSQPSSVSRPQSLRTSWPTGCSRARSTSVPRPKFTRSSWVGWH